MKLLPASPRPRFIIPSVGVAAAATVATTAAEQRLEARLRAAEQRLEAEILRNERNEDRLKAFENSLAALHKAVFQTTWIRALALVRRGKSHDKDKDNGLVKGRWKGTSEGNDKGLDKGEGNGGGNEVGISGHHVDDGDDDDGRSQMLAILNSSASAQDVRCFWNEIQRRRQE